MDALVVGYCHYLPFSFTDAGVLELDPAVDDRGLGRSVLPAFAAGLAACDRVLAHSSAAASWTTAAAARTGVGLGDKLHIVPAPRDVRLVRDPAGITSPAGRATGIYKARAKWVTEGYARSSASTPGAQATLAVMRAPICSPGATKYPLQAQSLRMSSHRRGGLGEIEHPVDIRHLDRVLTCSTVRLTLHQNERQDIACSTRISVRGPNHFVSGGRG
ncbi:hypothetical protein [Streptomyces sp. wa1063]|uniref:hypothetical protein n=1 Tax=Streptomyces sp. wa1063 TaxID=1828212 RepID=UPI00211D6599|nr:hypothetical protein [Streptomyces sp. wa1063]